MMISEKRKQAASEAVGRIRQIEKDQGVNYEALKAIRDELIHLTRDTSLFPVSYTHLTLPTILLV